ncbi:hypothetical protein BJX68DRAFT_267976 [Aspergillus pseudodeflectus]|uniref:Uncharacterized protein n=1 Tax=Aspergillus pseudodeflectus TaxID=176178 RepID=A0ABR4K8F3_9EURO
MGTKPHILESGRRTITLARTVMDCVRGYQGPVPVSAFESKIPSVSATALGNFVLALVSVSFFLLLLESSTLVHLQTAGSQSPTKPLSSQATPTAMFRRRALILTLALASLSLSQNTSTPTGETAAYSTTDMWLLFGGLWTSQAVVASIMGDDATATTYNMTCAPNVTATRATGVGDSRLLAAGAAAVFVAGI